MPKEGISVYGEYTLKSEFGRVCLLRSVRECSNANYAENISKFCQSSDTVFESIPLLMTGPLECALWTRLFRECSGIITRSGTLRDSRAVIAYERFALFSFCFNGSLRQLSTVIVSPVGIGAASLSAATCQAQLWHRRIL